MPYAQGDKGVNMAKNKGGNTVNVITALVEPILAELNLRLWDVRYEKEGPDWFLRIYIDRDEPLDIDTCEAATRAMNPVIDEADPIDGSYYLEVGSPGLGRKLCKDEHFAACIGQKAEAVLIRPLANGAKSISGILKGKNGSDVCFMQDDEEIIVTTSQASYFKLCDDENLFG